jgi:hypothetical protein
MWLDIAPGNLVWVVSSLLMSIWTLLVRRCARADCAWRHSARAGGGSIGSGYLNNEARRVGNRGRCCGMRWAPACTHARSTTPAYRPESVGAPEAACQSSARAAARPRELA